mmetsp:Transcript_64849/g.180527  ORF Transcript_64849/g.180527 Transcript_64849/m.180527 type:complete len:266 (+) Transcript_64849:83-880(+)
MMSRLLMPKPWQTPERELHTKSIDTPMNLALDIWRHGRTQPDCSANGASVGSVVFPMLPLHVRNERLLRQAGSLAANFANESFWLAFRSVGWGHRIRAQRRKFQGNQLCPESSIGPRLWTPRLYVGEGVRERATFAGDEVCQTECHRTAFTLMTMQQYSTALFDGGVDETKAFLGGDGQVLVLRVVERHAMPHNVLAQLRARGLQQIIRAIDEAPYAEFAHEVETRGCSRRSNEQRKWRQVGWPRRVARRSHDLDARDQLLATHE